MFSEKKVSLNKELWERVKRFAELAGMKATDSDENIRKKLKGLGYIE